MTMGAITTLSLASQMPTGSLEPVALPHGIARRIESIDLRLMAAAAAAAEMMGVDDPGHDWSHIARCAASALAIGQDVGADLVILMPAVFFHDCVNLPKDHPQRREASTHSARRCGEVLAGLGYQTGEACRIADVIIEHSYTLGKTPSSLESAVLQDVDKLDAMGAIGVMRAVTCGVRLGTLFYDPTDPAAENRPLDDRQWMIDHFFQKLLRLESAMHTEPARREAARRAAFLRCFLETFMSEVGASETSWAAEARLQIQQAKSKPGGDYA